VLFGVSQILDRRNDGGAYREGHVQPWGGANVAEDVSLGSAPLALSGVCIGGAYREGHVQPWGGTNVAEDVLPALRRRWPKIGILPKNVIVQCTQNPRKMPFFGVFRGFLHVVFSAF
jgi:hypothetical protein